VSIRGGAAAAGRPVVSPIAFELVAGQSGATGGVGEALGSIPSACAARQRAPIPDAVLASVTSRRSCLLRRRRRRSRPRATRRALARLSTVGGWPIESASSRGSFAMGDSQQDAQVERTQMLEVDQFQKAVEGHGSVLACGRIAGCRERACRCFELGGVAACAGRRPVAPSWRRAIALSRRTSIIVLASHRRGVVGRSEWSGRVRGHAASVRAR
jgi:hypothetical protein